MTNALDIHKQTQLEIKEKNIQLKKSYLDLIARGYAETKALDLVGLPYSLYLRFLQEDPNFVSDLDLSRKSRADFWVSKIIEEVDHIPDPKEVGGERLKFDKLQFLAKADNPDKYGKNSKTDIHIDLGQFKLLPPEEALKALKDDPFAIVDADFSEVTDNPKDEDLL